MVRWTNVLVATDLSEPADRAVREAHERAGSGARLSVCHVMPPPHHAHSLLPHFSHPSAEAATARDERAREAVTARVAQVTGRLPAEFTVLIEVGEAAVSIVRTAEAIGADLVVLGSHGATGLSRILLGTVAEKVTRLAHCPVLVVRPRTGSGRVVAGTDFSDPALPALEAAREEAERLGGRVTFVHSLELPVVDSEFLVGGTAIPPLIDYSGLEANALDRLRGILASHGMAGDCRVVFEPASRALVREAESARADLVVVGTHGRTGIGRMLLGSVAESVVGTAPCSVLVVRLHERGGRRTDESL